MRSPLLSLSKYLRSSTKFSSGPARRQKAAHNKTASTTYCRSDFFPTVPKQSHQSYPDRIGIFATNPVSVPDSSVDIYSKQLPWRDLEEYVDPASSAAEAKTSFHHDEQPNSIAQGSKSVKNFGFLKEGRGSIASPETVHLCGVTGRKMVRIPLTSGPSSLVLADAAVGTEGEPKEKRKRKKKRHFRFDLKPHKKSLIPGVTDGLYGEKKFRI